MDPFDKMLDNESEQEHKYEEDENAPHGLNTDEEIQTESEDTDGY